MKRIIFALMCFMLFSITAPPVSASDTKDKTQKIEKQSVIVDQNLITFDAVQINMNFRQIQTEKAFILEKQNITYFEPKLTVEVRQIDYGINFNDLNKSINQKINYNTRYIFMGIRWQSNEGYNL